MSEVDSLETFNSTTEKQIRTLYGNRCAFCLHKRVVEGSRCVHILDVSRKGASQVAVCSQLDIIPRDYSRQSQENGIFLCAGCHIGLFSPDYIAFCPPREVLKYLVKYMKDTPPGDQIPLYQVINELTTSNPQGLPDPSSILPYIGLYTIVHLKATQLRNVDFMAGYFPPPSVLRNGRWEDARTRSTSTGPNVARIFDSLAVNDSGQRPSPGLIPLHPDHPHYSPKQYWHLPKTSLGGILSAVVLRAMNSPSTADDELEMVRALHMLLRRRRMGGVDAGPSGPSGEDHRENEGGGGRRGGKGRPGIPHKRAAEEESVALHTRSFNKCHRG